jgi:hypothetical protein
MTKEKKAAVEETVVVEKTKKVPEVKKPTWEVKDRTYYLKGRKTPLTLTIPCKHTRKHPLLWFDTETQIQKEIRYATNQNSPFADEQKGEATLGHVTFRDGSVILRNIAIRAKEAGIIRLSQDQRTFTWGSNNRKLMNVPFDENPYSAFAAFLKTDEGVEIYKSIEKKLN